MVVEGASGGENSSRALGGSRDSVTRALNKLATAIVTYICIRVHIILLTKSHDPPSPVALSKEISSRVERDAECKEGLSVHDHSILGCQKDQWRYAGDQSDSVG